MLQVELSEEVNKKQQTPMGCTVLIPFVEAIVTEVDTQNGTVLMTPPDGLLQNVRVGHDIVFHRHRSPLSNVHGVVYLLVY